jgi:polysaccharide export outer membrane protein
MMPQSFRESAPAAALAVLCLCLAGAGPGQAQRPVDPGASGPKQAPQAETKSEPQDERPAVHPEFRLGAGDTIRVDVWKEPDVSAAQAVIRPDCRITLPLIKDVEVCGMTAAQVQSALTEKLSKFISAPDVTVVVLNIQSRKIYFVGNVRRPGPMPLLQPLTLAQALAEQGGPSEISSMKNVILQREEEGKPVQYKFNYKNYLKGEKGIGDMKLLPGDIIHVK